MILAILFLLSTSLALGSGGNQYGSVELSLEPNRGQAAPDVLFLGRADGYVVTGKKNRLEFQFNGSSSELVFRGAAVDAKVLPVGEVSGRTNYLIGADKSRWRSEIPHYSRFQYKDLYPGIDLVVYGTRRKLEYDFVVHPGADPGVIAFDVKGDGKLGIENGQLVLDSSGGRLVQARPVVYQGSQLVDAHYELDGRTVRFALGEYQRDQLLTIDPVVSYSTYIGGLYDDVITAMVVDKDGNAYLTGNTSSISYFPTTPGAYSSVYRGGSPVPQMVGNINAAYGDAFIMKLDPTGTRVVYSTYLGGLLNDKAFALAVDTTGSVYVAGTTLSTNFPTTGSALQRTFGGPDIAVIPGQGAAIYGDAFVSKLTPDGSGLVYSTYFGGKGGDVFSAISVDGNGNAYVVGTLQQAVFSTAFVPGYTINPGTNTGTLIAKLNPTGGALGYVAWLGAMNPRVIRANPAGELYVAGSGGLGIEIPVTPGVVHFNRPGGPTDDFVFKLDTSGTGIVWATYAGGNSADTVVAMELDTQGNVYLAGNTDSTDIATTPGAYQTAVPGGPFNPAACVNGRDGFVAKLNPTATAYIFQTYLGGGQARPGGDSCDRIGSMAVDSVGSVYLFGMTGSADFPFTLGALPSPFTNGQSLKTAPFVSKLDPTGSVLMWSSFLANPQAPLTQNIGVDSAFNVYLSGAMGVNDQGLIPTPGALETVFCNGCPDGVGTSDSFALKLDFSQDPIFSAAGVGNAASYGGGAVAPGEIIVIYGNNLGPAVLQGAELTPNGFVASQVADVQVLFDGVPAPIVYVSKGQVSVIVPYAVDGKSRTLVQANYGTKFSQVVRMPVVPSLPGLFSADGSGRGGGAFFNNGNSLNTPANPIAAGGVFAMYGTGEGQTVPNGVDGKVANFEYPKSKWPVTATIGGLPAEIVYSGAAPQAVAGLFQMNLRVPSGLPAGGADVVVKIGDSTSPSGLKLYVK